MIGVDLLGHGDAPKPHDPDAYADMTARIAEALPAEPVDVVGFSMGAITTLRLAIEQPERFRRIVLAGIGRTSSSATRSAIDRSSPASRARRRPTTTSPGCSGSTPRSRATTACRLAAVMQAPGRGAFTKDELATVTCPVLVVIGDRDFAGPADQLVDALPDARGVTLRNVDHFATPESFGFIDAVLEFLDAVPDDRARSRRTSPSPSAG